MPAIDTPLVRRLVRAQFPRWASLPVVPLASGGTVNAVYRLGDDLTVRLPRTANGAGDATKEARVLASLGDLPVAVPAVAGLGEPAAGYPWPWSVHRWLDGEPALEGHPFAPEALAEFVIAVRSAKADAPPAYRGGPLTLLDRATRDAVEVLRHTDEPFDASAALEVWTEALDAPVPADGWVHGDLMPSNLLVHNGHLTAVLDWATAGIGDPACDLIPAWNLLTEATRPAFRDAVDVDDAA